MTFVYIPAANPDDPDILQFPACHSDAAELFAHNQRFEAPFRTQGENLRKESAYNWKKGMLIGALAGAFISAIVTNAIVTGVI